MKRREFITLAGSIVVCWPIIARAQQPAGPEIGLLNSASPSTFEDRLRAFRDGLKESGYIEGDNVTIVYRWSEGQNDRLPAMASELANRRVAVIAALGEAATYAAKAATSTIPIVFNVDDDPVKLGLVTNMARPDGNLTGTNFFVAELTSKRLELLRQLVPTASRLAVLVNPAYPVSKSTVRDVTAAAPAMGFSVRVFEASTGGEIDAVFATLVREKYDALFVGGDPFYTSVRAQLVDLTARHAIPGRGDEPMMIGHITPFIHVGTSPGDLRAGTLTGSASAVAEQLLAATPKGVNQLQVRFDTRDSAEQCDQIAVFGNEVGPLLKR